MKRFSSRDMLLMLAPVAVLGGFGWLLSARKPAVVTPLGPFQPYIRRVQVLPARPVDVFDGYDTRVVIELDARGHLPTWWTKGGSSYYSGYEGQLVQVSGKKMTSLGPGSRCYRDSPHIDSKSKRWVSIYNLKLHDVAPTVGQIRLRDTVQFMDNRSTALASLWLDAPIRAKGVGTKTPSVSHNPCVKLEQFSLETTPPIESHDGVERWRAKWVVLQNVARTGAEAYAVGANMEVKIVNGQGQQVGSEGRSEFSSQDSSEVFSIQSNDPRRSFISEDYSFDQGRTPVKPHEPLWLQGDIRSGDKWPLVVKIPLRDTTGKMLFTPRIAAVPFRVASVSKVAPTPDEVTTSGADTTVSVVVQAWKPGTDVSKWKWEANYSQHVHSAKGGDFWELPFPAGKSVMGVSYRWDRDQSRMEVRYPFVLKSIPASKGKLVFRADIAANGSRRVPVEVTVRP